MILNRFFKPKWQNNDPQVRKQAMQEIDGGDPILAQLAQQDHDPEVRRAALERVNELDLLRQIAEQDSDAQVREFADARLRELLAGKVPEGPSLEMRLLAIESLPASYLEFLVSNAAEPALRSAVLERVDQQSVLKKIAVNDPAVEVRLAALERVHEASDLEAIVKQSRNRDKRIYRRARERLENLRAERARWARIKQLCEEMETLVWDGETGRNVARFPKLEKEWQELEAFAEAEMVERYRQSREGFLAARHESVARRTARQELCVTLERFLETIQNELELTSELDSSIQATLQRTQNNWEQCGALEDLEGQRLEQRFSHIIQGIKEQERVLSRNHERADRLREILGQADKLLHQPSEVLESDLTALKKRWTGLERPESRTLATVLQNEFEAVLGQLHERLKWQAERRDQELQELQALVGSVEKALDEGTLQRAISLHEQARKRLKSNIGLSRKQMIALEERLHVCMPRMGELRDWRRWGTNQAREHLCEDAESLIGLEADPVIIAGSVKELRNAWKSLDGTEGGASRSLWKRFDKACEKAYEPCQAYFDAQNRERQNNLSRREALCERLEQFEAHTDWAEVDWHEADQIWREAHKEWRKIGPVNRAERKAIERRFNAALKRLDTHLKEERTRELQRRWGLIHWVQELVQSGDLSAAIKGAKQAQAEWQATVQASRREEQALWKEFRAVCDMVFERRHSEQQAADQERQTNLDRKTALCDEIEALARVDSDGIAQAKGRVREAQEEWSSIGPVPKIKFKAIEQRFEAACKRVGRRDKELQRLQVVNTLQGLQDRANLCSRVEALLGSETPGDTETVIEQARQAWKELPSLRTSLVDPIRRRFNMACQAVAEGPESREALRQNLQANLKQKQALCLHMEVLAGVESPPEFAQARMQFQVERLSESLNKREGAKSPEEVREEAWQIEQQWYLLGLLPAEQNAVLNERFKRALNALNELRD